MNENGLHESIIFSTLAQFKKSDTNYDKVLSSMCTVPHKAAIDAHMLFIESNIGDPGLFRGTWELEGKIINSLAELMNHPFPSGYMTSGGTESNIQAIRAMRNSFYKESGKQRLFRPNLVVPESAHFSFDKISDILDVELRKASLDDEYRVSSESVKSLIDQNTIGLVAIAGSTEFGQVDPVAELSEIALKNKLFLHVDAAFGGFVLPFLDTSFDYDFKLRGVTSMSIDPHKMGMSTIPSGVLLFRDPQQLNVLKIDTPYLSVPTQYTLTGTRSGAAIAATYAVMCFLGREGYRKIVSDCMQNTSYLIKKLNSIDVQPVIRPVTNVVALKVKNPDLVRVRLLVEYRWKVSIIQNPNSLRLVIMPHVNTEMLDQFVDDLATVLATI